ncbi:hypothetical protein QUICO_53 [Mycobacterium phage Quico]|nr:hypothetical protein QUICO_53 [Mycobacterium phage Quico]AKU45636.1 hypothetical protein QUICO_53 [Mycobacterium phage Quico]
MPTRNPFASGNFARIFQRPSPLDVADDVPNYNRGILTQPQLPPRNQ